MHDWQDNVEFSNLVVDDILGELRKRFVSAYAMTDDIEGVTTRIIQEIKKGEGLAQKWGDFDLDKIRPILSSMEDGSREESSVYSSAINLSVSGLEAECNQGDTA